MQKKLIALAVAGLASGAAFAQSNVTIYGQIYTSFENVRATGGTTGNAQLNASVGDLASRNNLTNNSSYLGFKGSESLGNGLTAVYQFETGFNSDTGGWGSGRDTLVGLAGGFGTVAAGNLTGPTRAIGAAMDVAPGATTRGFSSLMGQVAGIKTTVDDRTGNTVAYISPTFGGFYGVIAYSANESKNNDAVPPATAATYTNDNPLWTLGLTYANGPIYVAYGYVDAKDRSLGLVTGGTAGTTKTTDGAALFVTALGAQGIGTVSSDTLKTHRLAGKYTFGPASVGLLWDRQKINLSGATGSTDVQRDVWAVNGGMNFGANYVYALYSRAGNLKGGLCTNGVNCGDTGASQFTLGYAYNLSKRTSLNAYYSAITNKSEAAYDFYINGVNPGLGADPRTIGAGIRHTF